MRQFNIFRASAASLLAPLMITTSLHASAEAKTEVTHVSQHGFIVKNQTEIAASSDVVWQALVQDVDKWWPKDHSWWGAQGTFSIDAHAGGCFCETAGERSAEHMHISFVDPGKLLRMTGGLGPLQGMGMHGALDWLFSGDEETTTITLTYSVSGIRAEGFDDLAPIVAKVQGQQLNGLKQLVESDR